MAPVPLPSLALAFLREDYARIDPELPGLLALLAHHGARECWHKHGTFFDHLLGVYRTLRLWGQRDHLCHAGLFHSAYSNEFVDLAVFAPETERALLAARLGRDTEAMVHEFCVMPRRQLIEALLSLDTLPEVLTLSERGVTVRLERHRVQDYTVLTVADLADQWFDWQDEVWAGQFGLPLRREVPPTFLPWPGPFRPSRGAFRLLSQLARHLRGLPTAPGVFNRCTQVLTLEDDAEASELYVKAHSQGANAPGEALAALRGCIRANPFLAEPRLLKAQLLLSRGAFEEAEEDAREGLDLLCVWGGCFDKRMSWQTWVAWARVLLEHAGARQWPTRPVEHNRLGLVVARVHGDEDERPVNDTGD